MNSTFRTDWSIASKAKIRKLFFLVIITRIHYLLSSLFAWYSSIAWLWNWSILRCRSLFVFSWFWIILELISPWFSIVSALFIFVWIIIVIPIWPFVLVGSSWRFVSIFFLTFYRIIQSLKLHDTRLIQLGFLTTFSACIDLDEMMHTGELCG